MHKYGGLSKTQYITVAENVLKMQKATIANQKVEICHLLDAITGLEATIAALELHSNTQNIGAITAAASVAASMSHA